MARTCIYGHLEERGANGPTLGVTPHLELDDDVPPGREPDLGRLRHGMSVIIALPL